MSTGTNQFERLWKLQANVNKLILDGKRDPEKLANILQAFKEGSVHSSFDKTASWCEEDGVIYLSVTSDGTTGEDWITRLESKGFRVGDYAKQLLRSSDFKPTSGVTTEIAILKGTLFGDNDRITKKIRAAADKKGWLKPHWEVACLIRDTFTDEQLEQMGLWYIVTMHEPIKDSGGDPLLLYSHRYGGGRWLRAYYGRPDVDWDDEGGFAFAVPQVGPQT